MAITVEELEIIIEAKIEKVMPQIDKLVSEVEKRLKDSNVDFSSISKSVNTEVNKAKPIIKKLKKEFNPDEVSFKINGESAKKEITGISKQFKNLKGSSTDLSNAFELSRYNEKLKQIEQQADKTSKKVQAIKGPKVGYVSYDSSKIESKVNELSGINPTPNLDKSNKSATSLTSKIASAVSEGKKLVSTTLKVGSAVGIGIKKAGQMAGAFLRIRKNANSIKNIMSQGVRQVIRYAGALIGIRSIYNGLKSLASEWMSSNDASAKQLTANLNYIKMALGSSLQPVIEMIINLIYKAVSAVQSLIYAFTGVNIFAKMTAENYKKMASGASSASKATKQLAGIHNEINNISDSESGGGGVSTPNVDLSNVDTKMSDMFKKMLSDAYMFGFSIGQKINEGLNSIDWASIQATIITISMNIANFLNGLVDGIDWSLIGYTIAQGLNTALLSAYTFLTTFNFENFGVGIGNAINTAISTFNWSLLGATLGAKLQAIIDFAYGILLTFDFNKFGVSIATAVNSWFNSIDWNKLATDFAMAINGIFETAKGFIDTFDWAGIAITLSEGINTWFEEIDWVTTAQTLSDGVKGVLDSIIFFLGTLDWGEIGASIGDFIASIDWLGIIEKLAIIVLEVFGGLGISIITGVCEGIAMAVVNIATFICDNVVSPIIETFKSLFGIHSPSTVMAEIGEFIMQGLINGILNLLSKIIEVLVNIKDNIVNKITEAKNKAINLINELKNKISSIFSNIVSTIKSKITSIKTNISNTFSSIVSTVTSKINSIKNTIINGFSTATNFIKNLSSSAFTWGKDMLDNLINGIKSKIGDVKNAIGNVAQTIKSIIGFSEPEKGPLSNFHTYMPDMIDLMKKGIKDNIGSLMDTVHLMAEEMATTLNTGDLLDYSVVTSVNADALQSFGFRDVVGEMSSRENTSSMPQKLIVKIGESTIFEQTIDYINDKTKRVGKSVIKVE